MTDNNNYGNNGGVGTGGGGPDADPTSGTPKFLQPPAVAALRQEARQTSARPSATPSPPTPMERTFSQDIRDECEDLKEAAEQTLNVVVDVEMDGRIKWASPTWKEVIGTEVEEAEGKFIRDIVLDDDSKSVFDDAIESLKRDDSRSYIVRFAVKLGPASEFLRPNRPETSDEPPPPGDQSNRAVEPSEGAGDNDRRDVLNLEGQGILVYETEGGSHTMWMLRPSSEPREVTIGLPPLLLESLGVGAEMLANYLNELAEVGINDPAHHPPPMPILCRICERQITPWWFEKHSDLCMQEQRAEMDVQLAQDNLNEHRNSIVKVLDVLESRKGRSPSGTATESPAASQQAEYKGLSIGPSPSTDRTISETSSSSGSTPPLSRDPSTSGLGHGRQRSFAVRRPLTRIVELIMDLCDTALEINTPALKESRTDAGDEIRTQSPQSESRISQVLQWQSPSSNTLGQEQGLAALSVDTENAARAKVNAVFRHRKIVEYSERIRVEFAVLVEECIAEAMSKADRAAAGDLGDSTTASSSCDEYPNQSSSTAASAKSVISSEQQQEQQQQEQGEDMPASSVSTADPSPSDIPQDLSTIPVSDKTSSSAAVSSRSSSPLECPTPRSHRSLGGVLGQPMPSKRTSFRAESDAADSDSSALSSSLAASMSRTDSPLSERGGLSRVATTSTADGAGSTGSTSSKRRSLILPGISSSPRRESPGRNQPPHSPLRRSKPRLSAGESLPSPTTSPLLSATELAPSSYAHHMPHPPARHHRRQSSTTSPDASKSPMSPHMSATAAGHPPPPRAIAPSIKDFEIIKPISKGAFGSVYLSKKKSTAEYFAIKVLKKTDMIAKNQVTNVKAERAIMMWQGESDFVAKLYWTFSSKDYLYLVMEYLNGGDCASLVKVLGGLPEDWAKKYIAEVVLGLEHLHEKGIVHRDLKPDNLLIDPKGHLKLTDFGLSRMGLVGRQKRIQKSPHDSAPDLLKQGPFTTTATAAGRSTSIGSSRSASFDFPASQSPNSTPLISPEPGSQGQPSYFSLNREPSLSREHSRRTSGYRSDSGGSDSLGAVFRNFPLHESSGDSPPVSYHQGQQVQHQQQHHHHGGDGSIEEETYSEGSDSPQLFPAMQHSASNSLSGQRNTPPPQSMMPPAMALFDPADQNRRFVGTPDYLAPETINGFGQDEMCDWWSLGCILFEFLYGYPPFNAATPDEVFENILNRRINWPEDADELVSPDAKDILNQLMTVNPQERLAANTSEKFSNGGAEVRNHPWFADVDWETLFEDEGQFVPAPQHPEDTEYFDARGATLQAFPDELEDQVSASASGSGGEQQHQDRPHDALFKVKSQPQQPEGGGNGGGNGSGSGSGGNMKRGLMPLHIPPHVRESRNRRLSEPSAADDFGDFSFKNLPILDKANKDVIQKLKQEALQAQQRPMTGANAPASPAAAAGPSLEGSPSLKRTMSHNRVNRPSSPSLTSLNQPPPAPPNTSNNNGSSAATSSPHRSSQPSSPLLLQFSAGAPHHERRKTSGSSSTFSPQSTTSSATTGGTSEPPRSSAHVKMSASVSSSPVKQSKMPIPSPDMPQVASLHRQYSAPASRQRSHTLGSQDSDTSMPKEPYVPGHHKRRSQLFDVSPSSSDNEGDPRAKALLKVQRRRQSSRRLSQITLGSGGAMFRPLDVLICEDHPVSRLVLERLFEKLRCRTITAVNGSEATRYALSEVQFDIILTEFKLPQINGADVARMVRDTKSVNTGTPVIAVTGYLKDLPETHHFDWLIEKPPTLAKLTEVLSKFCQWKPPPKDDAPPPPPPFPHHHPHHQHHHQHHHHSHHPAPPPPMRVPGLPQTSSRLEDSPSSISSGFGAMPTSSYRGSSREDSIGSSYFGDSEPVAKLGEDIPVITSRAPTDEFQYAHPGGLGISEEGKGPAPTSSTTLQPTSAPVAAAAAAGGGGVLMPAAAGATGASTRKRTSVEGIRAKRESAVERRAYEGAESGDDEDEELGHGGQGRAKGAREVALKARRSSSKLGTEMMRTNSRGSVVSSTEEYVKCSDTGDLETVAPTAASPRVSTTTTTEHLEDALECVHLGDEGLEALPEDPEKEESCTPPVPQRTKAELEAQLREAALADHHANITDPTASTTDTPRGNITPPGNSVSCAPALTTPDSTRPPAKDNTPEDADVTPRPVSAAAAQGPRGDAAAEPQGESEQTPRASDRDRSRTRANIMKWIQR